MNKLPNNTKDVELRQPDHPTSKRLLEDRVRRAAKSVGLRALKSRNRFIDNAGQFQLIDRYTGSVKAGHGFELSADDVLEFCRRWPEESKFDLGASQQWDRPWPRHQSIQIDVLPVPDLASRIATPQMLETRLQLEMSVPDVELELYREIGFPNGPKDIELEPRPPGILTFEEVYKEFGYKRVDGLKALAHRLGYPPLAIAKERITKTGIQWLKNKRQKAREQQKENSRQRTKKQKNAL